MVAFRCERFPHGVAHIRTVAGVVDFTDGAAEVTDPALIKGLREVPAVFRIIEEGGPAPVGPPPKGGPGSGADAWAAYANAHDVNVPDGANRDQIRALLAEHGVPTE